MRSPFHVIGIDIGSVSVTAAVIDHNQQILAEAYAFHRGNIFDTLDKILSGFDLSRPLALAFTSSSPAGIDAGAIIDNRIAIIAAARCFQRVIGSILIVGAEKFGAIFFDKNGNYQNYRTNTSCAAGTGSFLDQQAKRLNLSGIEALSQKALSNTGRLPKIASRCAVFAKTDIVHAQQEGYTLEEICDGLCYGLARNVVDTLFIREKPTSPIIFTGGVSKNKAVIKHIRSLVDGEIVTDNTFVYGAAGAALCLLKNGTDYAPVRIRRASDILRPAQKKRHDRHPPLVINYSDYPDFNRAERYLFTPQGFDTLPPVEIDIYQTLKPERACPAYLGLDIGSTSTKAVLMGVDRRVLAGFYTRTAGRPVDAVREILATIVDLALKKNIGVEILAAGTTGSGRKFTGRLIGADRIVDEITAHARAAVELNPNVDTIIEIGGQDAKFTTLKNGRVTFSIMNSVCAAGTGSFIEEQAQKLNCPLAEYSQRTENRKAPIASDRCTVFMERDINYYLNEGFSVDEVLASVLHSVCENYLSKVAIEKNIGQTILFQGATAKNRALVAAFEQRLKKPLQVSPCCHLTGAIGSALILHDEKVDHTRFKGLALYRHPIPIRSEVCSLCTNHCKISVAVADKETVAYGFLCGRDYHTQKHVNNNRSGFDLLQERKKLFRVKPPASYRHQMTIGIPAALHLQEDLPFWQVFFDGLGIRTLSSDGFKHPLKAGKQLTTAEFCAPMTALHGHVSSLLDRCDFIFLPFYLEKKTAEKEIRRQYCYYTQFSPALTPAMNRSNRAPRFLRPLVHSLYNIFYTKAQLYQVLKSAAFFPVHFLEVSAAYDNALAHQAACEQKLKALYKKRAGTGLHAVFLGRPYTVLSDTMNKGIPAIFAALGIRTFYQDMLSFTPADVIGIESLLRQIHWNYAAKILESAEVVAKTKGAYPVLITAFKCSPDAFVTEYFKKILDHHEKPYLVLQLDEHDSSVGYETRIEAAIRSFENHHAATRLHSLCSGSSLPVRPTHRDLAHKTLLLPNWDSFCLPLVVANLNHIGIDARLLEESVDGIRRSLRYNTGQCLPLNVIAQEFVDYVDRHGLDPANTLLWLGDSQVSCNIKLYPHHIETLLHEYGTRMEQAGIYVGAFSMLDISLKLPLNNYLAFLFGGLVRQLGCRIRPYETHPGTTDQVIDRSLRMLTDSFLGKRAKLDTVAEIVSLFEAIAVQPEYETRPRPKVAVFGDLYVRDNDVFNQGLIHYIERHGGEVITTPYTDYIKMVAGPYFKKWFFERRYISVLSSKALMASARYKEKLYYKYFQRILQRPLHEYDMPPETILSRYNLRIENSGESMDNILKLFYIKKYFPAVSLFVQASPAFCCPALITEAMAKEIEKKIKTPIISITYDGTGGIKNDAVIPYLKFPHTATAVDLYKNGDDGDVVSAP